MSVFEREVTQAKSWVFEAYWVFSLWVSFTFGVERVT